MQQETQAMKDFAEYYFKAAYRAGETEVGAKLFLVKDRLHLVKQLIQLIDGGVIAGASGMGVYLSDYETPGIRGDDRRIAKARHSYRLKRWLAEYYSGSLGIENAVTVKSSKSMNLVPDDIALFKRNLIETVKAVCSSALKNDLHEDEIHVILNSGLILAKEERKVQEVKLAFNTFLREKGITKDIALQLLD